MFAPRLSDNSNSKHRIKRTVQLFILSCVSALLLIVNFALNWASYYLVEKSATSVEIYHNTWRAVKDNIHDEDKLKDWDQWEHKFDNLIKTDADAVFYAREMVGSLGDPYSRVLDPNETKASYNTAFGKFIGVGIEFDVAVDAAGQALTTSDGKVLPATGPDGLPVVRNVLRGSPALASGLKRGDQIELIDGKKVAGLTLDSIRAMLQGDAGTFITITYRRGSQTISQPIVRREISLPVVSTAVLPGKVGYLRIEHWGQLDTVDQIRAALMELEDCESLVVDLRNNPGGLVHLVFQSLAMFMDEGLIATEHVRVPGEGYLSYQIRLTANTLQLRTLGLPIPFIRDRNLSRNRPLVVLVNEGTASASEIFASALKENGRAIIIGKKTFGKGIGQTYVPVGNGVRLRITNFRTYTPHGNWVGNAHDIRIGISPDIDVDGVFDGRVIDAPDPQLLKALEFLRRGP